MHYPVKALILLALFASPAASAIAQISASTSASSRFERPLSLGMSGIELSRLLTLLRTLGYFQHPAISGNSGTASWAETDRRRHTVAATSTIHGTPPRARGSTTNSAHGSFPVVRVFERTSTIRGMGINPPDNDWTAEQGGLTATRSDALKFAGYNSLRIFVDFDGLMDAQQPSARVDLADAVSEATQRISHAVSDGYKVVVATSLHPSRRLAVMEVPSEENSRFKTAWSALASAVTRTLSPANVALEIMNEPPSEADISHAGYQSYAGSFARSISAVIRAAAPHHTIAIGASDLQWAGALPNLNANDYDGNTIFTFHGYDPGEFSHQGQIAMCRHLDGLPWLRSLFPLFPFVKGDGAFALVSNVDQHHLAVDAQHAAFDDFVDR